MRNTILYTTFTIILYVYLSLSYTATAQNHRLVFEITGKEYNELSILGRTGDRVRYEVDGVQNNNNQYWSFLVPDSIYYNHISMAVIATDDSIYKHILFKTPIANDSARFSELAFTDGDTIHAKYLSTNSHIRYVDTENGPFPIDTLHFDSFFTPYQENLETRCIAQSPAFSMFVPDMANGSDSTYAYEQFLDKYASLVKKEPGSFYYLRSLAATLPFYKKATDIKRVFDPFTEKMKQLPYGVKIQEYLAANLFKEELKPFENHTLPNAKTKVPEKIVEDTGKYNLVVFSASWCTSCHAQIPILKQIYDDLRGRLIITYVSTDEAKTVDAWNKLMVKEDILWRSLLASNELGIVRKKYSERGVPHAILVHPDNNMEIIDVRNEKEKARLYQLVKE